MNFDHLIEKAKTDKKLLRQLKNAAVRGQDFELASQLREMETELFPRSQEAKDAKAKASDLSLLFRMIELNVAESTCWLLSETLSLHQKKKGKFDLKDAAALVARKKELFEENED
jgi:hypothetical protein